MTKIKTVDGPSSGLNADLLDGYHAGSFALSSHTHTFASLTSKPTTLSGYGITDAASSSHTHTFASLTSKPTTLSGYGITDAYSNTQVQTLLAEKLDSANVASASDIRSGATGAKFVTPAAIEAAAELVTLTDATTISVDWSSFINGVVTLSTNRTLGAPTNAEPGTVRTILVKGSTDVTLSFNAVYKNPPTVEANTSVFFMLTLFCETTTNFKVTGFETA